MLSKIIEELFGRGYIADADEILDLDETYCILSMSFPRGEALTVELFEDEEKGRLHLYSKLGNVCGISRTINYGMAYLAANNATEQLEDQIGKVILDASSSLIQFIHTAVVPIAQDVQYMADLVLNFAEGSLLVKRPLLSICTKASIKELTVDDIFVFNSDQSAVTVELHPMLRLSSLTLRHRQSLIEFIERENMTLEKLDVLFPTPTLDLYPVICDEWVSLRLSSGSYCRTIDKVKITSEKTLLQHQIRKCFDIYLALMMYLNIKPSKFQAYRSADELIDEIEDMLATD